MSVNMAKLKKKYKEVKERSEMGPFWLPSAGDNRIRILPPLKGMGDEFYREGGLHFNVGPDSAVVICPALTASGSCPVCDLVDELLESGKPADIKMAKALKVKSRFWMNIIDVNNKDRGSQVFGAGIQIFKEILGYFTDSDYGDLTDLKEGRDIILNKSGTGLETEYSVRPRPKTSVIKKSVLKDAIDLSKWDRLVPLGEDEILEMLGIEDDEDDEEDDKKGEDEEEGEDEDDEEDDKDDDDEDEEDDEEEEDDDEDEEDDEEEDDEDEEEEGEEKKPAKRSRQPRKKKTTKPPAKSRKTSSRRKRS